MFHDDGYALLIGIDDYSAFDRSTGRAGGTSDLQGSLNDVHVFWRLCTELGVAPENIRVLTSPAIDLATLPGATAANVGEATEKGVRDAVAWLGDKLAGGRAGVLTYSGHGAHTNEKGLLLCPSDVTGAGFDHAIAFTELRRILGDGAKDLTVVLDCCHGGPQIGADDRGRRVPGLGGDPVPEGGLHGDLQIGARVLAACRPGETTQQAAFLGLAHGAFSWAISSVVDQWKRVDQGGNVRLDLTYGTLVERARGLLAVLDLTGTPAIYGPPGVEALAVLQLGRRPVDTSATPDAARRNVQMDSGWRDVRIYTFFDPLTGTTLAKVAVPNVKGTLGGVTCAPGSEYWFDVSTAASPPRNGFEVGWADYLWTESIPSVGALSFTMAQSLTWKAPKGTAPPVSSSTFANGAWGVAVDWQLRWDGKSWSGALVWYYVLPQSNVFAGKAPATTPILSPRTTVDLVWNTATATVA